MARTDSKNPATTCRGITSAGRACRRSLAASSRSRTSQVSTFVSGNDSGNNDIHVGAAALFCWQHKDQADGIEREHLRLQQLGALRVKPQTSIDTLIDRLGVLDIAEAPQQHARHEHAMKDPKRPALRGHRREDKRPLSTIEKHAHRAPSATRPQRRKRRRKAYRGFLSFLCCGPLDNDPEESMPAPKKRTSRHANGDRPSISKDHTHQTPTPRRMKQSGSAGRKNDSEEQAAQRVPLPTIHRANSQRDPPSQTQTFLSIIPTHLSPQTVSSLLAELAKPLPATDEEGYIYIFSLSDPGSHHKSIPSKMISSPDSSISNPLPQKKSQKEPILLKIGRTSNVHRRLNEWTQQCGYKLTLIRFYPHLPSSSTPSPHPPSSPDTPPAKKVQHVRRVERLIQLELASQRVKNPCRACGCVHQEWFAVQPDVEGLRAVDETVRRWFRWAENV